MASTSTEVTGRLLSYPLASQIASLKRSKEESPQKIVAWFKHWENHLPEFKTKTQTLTDGEKEVLLELQRVFDVVMGREFKGSLTGANAKVVAMFQAFEVLQHLVKVVVHGHSNGLMVVGPGGTGKTYTITETLSECNKIQGRDYVLIKGFSTPLALYNELYEKNGKIFLIDDADGIFKDTNAVNILKAALDTLDKRTITWNTTSTKAATPSFDFTGRIIFVSNLDPRTNTNTSFQAMLTRVYTLIISATKDEMLVRMINLMPKIAVKLTTEQREEIIRFLQEENDKFNDFSLQFLVNLVGLREYDKEGTKWKQLALSLN